MFSRAELSIVALLSSADESEATLAGFSRCQEPWDTRFRFGSNNRSMSSKIQCTGREVRPDPEPSQEYLHDDTLHHEAAWEMSKAVNLLLANRIS